MNKIIYTLLILLTCTGFSYSQKYVLLDKQMAQPVTYTNTVTMEHSYKNLFPVEREKLHQFVAELEKLGSDLSNIKKPLPESINFNIGKTRFFGLKVRLAKESRMDIVLTTDCNGIKVPMHLSDAKISNISNAYFINTWTKYIKSFMK